MPLDLIPTLDLASKSAAQGGYASGGYAISPTDARAVVWSGDYSPANPNDTLAADALTMLNGQTPVFSAAVDITNASKPPGSIPWIPLTLAALFILVLVYLE